MQRHRNQPADGKPHYPGADVPLRPHSDKAAVLHRERTAQSSSHRWEATRNLALHAGKWTLIAVWFDLSGRFISAPLDLLIAQWPALTWLDGFVNVVK